MTVKELNDRFRSTFDPALGRVVMTSGVSNEGILFSLKAQLAVRRFKDFNAGDDPYEEHDFGMFFVDGIKCFFKIDYYDADFKYGAEDEDRTDPAKCRRLLTIMLADEY